MLNKSKLFGSGRFSKSLPNWPTKNRLVPQRVQSGHLLALGKNGNPPSLLRGPSRGLEDFLAAKTWAARGRSRNHLRIGSWTMSSIAIWNSKTRREIFYFPR